MYEIDIDTQSLHALLSTIYGDMMQMCEHLIRPAMALGFLGAVFYVASRVWVQIARNEAIDFVPLFRPLAIGFCILFFPGVLGFMNDSMQLINAAVEDQIILERRNLASFEATRDSLERAIAARNDKLWLVDDEALKKELADLNITDIGKISSMAVERAVYNTRKTVRSMFITMLEWLSAISALLIDMVRTFYLVILSIVGPLCFGIAIYDGFHGTLTHWAAKYINVSLWLPVAKIFSAMLIKIESFLVRQAIADLKAYGIVAGGVYGGDADILYMLYLLFSIVGFACVPTVCNWIVQAATGGSFASKVAAVASIAK